MPILKAIGAEDQSGLARETKWADTILYYIFVDPAECLLLHRGEAEAAPYVSALARTLSSHCSRSIRTISAE